MVFFNYKPFMLGYVGFLWSTDDCFVDAVNICNHIHDFYFVILTAWLDDFILMHTSEGNHSAVGRQDIGRMTPNLILAEIQISLKIIKLWFFCILSHKT